MTKLSIVLLLAALVLVSGFVSIQSEMDVIEGGGSGADCETILTSVQMIQKQLDKVDVIVQGITPNLRETMELKFYKLLEKIEHIIQNKFDALDKKMDTKFHETNTYLQSKLTVIEDKVSEHTAHVDSKINTLESTLTHALNASDTLNSNGACCKLCLETAALVRNTTTKINDMNMRTINVSVKLQEMNEAIQNLTDIVTVKSKNIIKQNDSTVSTEPAHKAPVIITPTEVTKPAPSKCDRSKQEECCTEAVVPASQHKVYTEMSWRGRHTVVNMTSAGLQEYTMYFAVKGDHVLLMLSPNSPVIWSDLYYSIGFYNDGGGYIWMNEHLLSDSERTVHSLSSTNIISAAKYIYYYLRISGDTLEVGRRGEPPLMTHTRTELKRLRYFSFKRWNTPGAALYDCTAE